MSLQLRRSRPFVGARSAVTRMAARQAGRFFRSTARRFTQRRNGPARSSAPRTLGYSNPLTTQHDYKLDYKRRKRTRKLRRRMRRARKFQENVVRSYLKYTTSPKKVAKLALFSRQCDIKQSGFFGCLLHTSDGAYAIDNPQADWREFFIEGSAENRQGWDQIADPVAGPQYPDISRRHRAMRCNSAAMELTVRNTGVNPALVNVYRVVCKLNFPFPGFTIEDLYRQGFQYAGRITEVTQPVEGTGNDGIAPPEGMWDSQMRPEHLTSTPFQSALFTRHFTIYRRTKYQLSPGEEFSIMLNSTRPKYVNMNKMRGNSFVKGMTHGVFVDFQGVPRLAGGDLTTETGPVTLSVQKMVRYSLNMLPEKRVATTFDEQDPDP